MYYLQSRYYDPAIGRFVNADAYATSNGYDFLSCNMFAYCENNPINRRDCAGSIWELALVSGGLSESFISVLAAGFSAVVPVVGWAVLGTVAVVGVVYLAKGIATFAKGGKQRIKDSGLADMSDQEIADRLKDPSTPKAEKQRIQKEQKARGNRNAQKRQNNNKSKGKSGNKIEVDAYNKNAMRRGTQ